ncbi:amidohydrolase family protein [Nitrosomonas marina]|uniref:Imidazolonepropionase n=1 Tax=Nitrosomonas marina TaxID=917 RepID=A0A1H8C1Z1_9PROT|nr:amidohydrolase family protein [Nitrosomonas marina]SEM88087.1 Imidazolonepropionase [Nitrosomonas marina]
MIKNNFLHNANYALILLILSMGINLNAYGHGNEDHSGSTTVVPGLPECQILAAARLFDGINFPQDNKAVLIEGNKIKQIGTLAELSSQCANQLDLGDSTILPGFIERHGHIAFQNVNKGVVLKNGITTAQDVGGPLKAMEGGQGTLRLLSSGPIIQTVDGYPLNIFGGDGGYDKIGITVSSVTEAEAVVQELVNGGASAIVISLEPGGEPGRHWQTHGNPIPATPWPMLSAEITQAIVTKAHALGKRVMAFVGEETGLIRALDANIDELVHIPCDEISDELLQRIADDGVTVVSTLDTHSSCEHMLDNAAGLGMKGARVIYGSEVAHDNVPWGINGQELHTMLHALSGETIDFADVVNVIKAATSKAAEDLGIPGLGTLAPDAPADIIAVKGNPFERFKILEYPDLVLSGGRAIVNNYINQSSEEAINCFFNWAEGKYSGVLAPAGVSTQNSGVYSYRYYPGTNAYLGVSSADHHLYYMNEGEGQLHDQGLLVNWLPVSECTI